MKQILNGLKKTKIRTVLSVLIILAVSVTACVSISMLSFGGKPSGDMPTEKFSQSQDTVSDGDTTQSSDTENTNTASDDENSNEQSVPGDIPSDINVRGGMAQNNYALYILIGDIVIGGVLLIIVNVVSAKKRKEEIIKKDMLTPGYIGRAKKSIFLETLIVILIAGVIGTGIGVGVASPISSAIRQSSVGGMSREKGDFTPNAGGEVPTNSDGETVTMPSGENGEAMTMPNGEKPSRKSDDNAVSDSTDDTSTDNSTDNSNENKTFERNEDFTQSINYVLVCAGSLATVVVLGLLTGVCSLACINNKQYMDDEDDEVEDEESDDE